MCVARRQTECAHSKVNQFNARAGRISETN